MAGVPETIYQGSGAASPAAALPTASPDVFGAGIGDAIAGAGAEIEQSSLRAMQADKERQSEADNASAAMNYAGLRLGVTKSVEAARDDAPLDGAGHVDTVAAATDKQVTDFLGSIKDPRVRQRWAVEAADMKAQVLDAEEGWQRGRRVQSIGTNATVAQNLWGNELQNTPTPDVFQQSLKAGDAFWDGAQGIDAETRDKGRREWKAGSAENFATGLIQSDPAQAQHLLTSGGLDMWLAPDKKRELVSRADTEVRILATDQRRQIDQAKSEALTAKTGMSQQIDQGVVVPDDQFNAAVTKLKSLGLDNQAEELQYQEGKLKLSRVTDHWTTADWNNNINPLAAKVAQGKASDDDQRELKILQELRPSKEARFHNDPDFFSSASGMTPPQVDITSPDGGAVQARKQWAVSFARTGHLVEPPYLNRDQLEAYRQRAAQGPVGQLEAAADLRNTWGMDAAPSIVRQIGGENAPSMQIMLGLTDRMSQVYRRGQEALGKNAVKLDDKQISQVWQRYLPGVPPDMAPALLDTARKITAGWMLEQGKTEPTADFADVFSKAIHRAGGMLGSWGQGSATGGFINFNGKFAWLPQDMARSDFQARVARARPGDWAAAAVDSAGNPVSASPHHLGPDGKLTPYTPDQLRRFGGGTLQTVAPGIYRLADPAGGTVVDQNGRPWQFDVRRLPRGHFGGAH